MLGMSKVKSWLRRKSFISIEQVGDTNSEYFQLEGFPVTVRLGDHLGRANTISDKYLNILPGDNIETFILVLDKTTQVVKYKELLKIITSLIVLYSIIPEYLKFKVDMKKDFQLKESDYTKEINNLKVSIKSTSIKMKEKLVRFSDTLKKLNNELVVEINNL